MNGVNSPTTLLKTTEIVTDTDTEMPTSSIEHTSSVNIDVQEKSLSSTQQTEDSVAWIEDEDIEDGPAGILTR